MKNVKRNVLVAILCSIFCLALSFAIGSKAMSAKAENVTDYVTGVSVTLNDSIVAKYYVDVPDGYTQAKMTFDYKGQSYASSKDVTSLSTAVFEFDKITPQDMTEPVSVSVEFTADGQTPIVDTHEGWSIASYCQDLLSGKPSVEMSDTEYAKMKALVVNLLNYGDKSQAYTEKEGTLPTSVITSDDDKALISSVVPSSDLAMSGTASESVSWAYAYLVFDNKVNLALEFWTDNTAMETYQEVTTLSITPQNGAETVIASQDFEVVENDGEKSLIKAVWEGLSVVDFDETLTAQIKVNGAPLGYALTYSVASYVASMQNSQNVKMQELATAVYNYGLAAGEYTAAQEIQFVGIAPLDGWYKSYYIEGEKFNPNGMKIGYEYSNGSIEGDVAFTCDTQTALTTATDSVTVTAGDYSVDLPVTVVGQYSTRTIEAESGKISGAMETVTSGGTLGYASNRSYLRNFTKDSSALYYIKSGKQTTGSVRLYLSSHRDDYNGSPTTTYPLTPAEYLKAEFNGGEVAFGKYEVLPSTSGGLERLCNWYCVTFDNLNFKAGVNTFKLLATVAYNTCTTAFDKLEVLYADQDAVNPEQDFTLPVQFEAEECVLNAGTSGTYGVSSSGQSAYFSNGTFVGNLKNTSTLTLTVNAAQATSVTLTMKGVATGTGDVDISTVVSALTLNGVAQAFTSGVCFSGCSGVPYTSDKHTVYTFGTYDLQAGMNVIVISLKALASGGVNGTVFIDYLTVSKASGIEITEATTYQAEDLTLSGISTTVKANGQGSGLFATMEANGDTDPGFIGNFKQNSTMTLTINLTTATKLKISIWGSATTANVDVTTAALIGGVTFNGDTATYNTGTCFVAPSAVTPATMATFSEYVLGEYDFVAGENSLVITFNSASASTYGKCFIDRLVVTPVA